MHLLQTEKQPSFKGFPHGSRIWFSSGYKKQVTDEIISSFHQLPVSIIFSIQQYIPFLVQLSSCRNPVIHHQKMQTSLAFLMMNGGLKL